MVIGARDFLIAYNVNLASRDVTIAKQIAREMRLLPGVRALGLWLESAGCAQVSMNLLDFRQTGIAQAFDAVESLARVQGVEAAESELIGLAPSAALNAEIARHVRLRDYRDDRILEVRLGQRRLN
jgi:glutamate formiminotransferase